MFIFKPTIKPTENVLNFLESIIFLVFPLFYDSDEKVFRFQLFSWKPSEKRAPYRNADNCSFAEVIGSPTKQG